MVLGNNESNESRGSTDRAVRLAGILLDQNKDDSFEVQFMESAQAREVSKALIELGCAVMCDERDGRLNVVRPPRKG